MIKPHLSSVSMTPRTSGRILWSLSHAWKMLAAGLMLLACLIASPVLAVPAELHTTSSGESFDSPEAAWRARASFTASSKAPHFLGWAKQPAWILLTKQGPAPQPYVYLGSHPVARFDAWSIDVQTGSARHIGLGGATVAPNESSIQSSPKVVIAWPIDSQVVLVRLEGIGKVLIEPQLVDANDLIQQARTDGWMSGAILCFLLLALAVYSQNIYLTGVWRAIGWIGLIVTFGVWAIAYNALMTWSLPGWTTLEINRLLSLALLSIILLYQLQIIDLLNIWEEQVWIYRGLQAITLLGIPAAAIGEIFFQSSYQGLKACNAIQILFVVAAGVLRRTKNDPEARRLILLGGVQFVALELHYASHWGIVDYSWPLHYAWQICMGIGMLIALWDGWMGNELERRLTRARKDRLQKLLLEEKEKLEVRVDERTAELQIALSELRHMESQQRRLLSLASHEFRTPATIIKSSLDVLDVLPESGSEMGKKQLSILRNASARLTFLANKLIDHDRWREMSVKPQFQHINLSDWLTAFAGETPPNINLATNIPQEPIYILGDIVLLRIAIQNLVDNATTHNKANGVVTLHLTSESDQAFIMVDDRGEGVPDKHKATVFDRFFSSRSDSFGQTHGLGLSIVKSVAQMHHGQARCEDAPGGGARFEIILPRSDLP